MAEAQDEVVDRPGDDAPTPDEATVGEINAPVGEFEEVVGSDGLAASERRELELLREARNADTHTRKGPTPYPRPRPTQTPAEPEYATPVEAIIGEYVSAQAAFTGLSTPASLRMQAAVLAFMYEVAGIGPPDDES